VNIGWSRLIPSAAETPITSVSWSTDGCFLAVGLDTGDVEIWDVEEGKKVRTMTGHSARVPSMSWFSHTLSSGCKDGSIWHHDVRVSRHKVMELTGHTGEVRVAVCRLMIGVRLDMAYRRRPAREWRERQCCELLGVSIWSGQG
jgi:WD40 repeat protein